jgi:hypothetical protein
MYPGLLMVAMGTYTRWGELIRSIEEQDLRLEN